MERRLDCIVIGYHDLDFQTVTHKMRSLRHYSGAYENIRTNSVPFGESRISYMDLLNRVLHLARGSDPQLHVGHMPSLGSWYLRSYLRKTGFQAEVVNFFTDERPALNELLQCRPLAVAITTTFYVDPRPITEIVQHVREVAPDVKIIVGGPYIFNLCDSLAGQPDSLAELLRAIGADIFVVDSQGELTLSRVLHYLRGDRHPGEIFVPPPTRRTRTNSLPTDYMARGPIEVDSLCKIPNLIFFEGPGMTRTPREVESNDMDVFSEDWSSVAKESFTPTAVTRTARSCAFSCAFCRYPIIAGPLNLKSLEIIERQFDLFHESGVKQVVIIDDTFNVPLPRFKAICRLMARKNYGFEWFSYFRASNSDEECFDLMAASKCGGVFLGIESGSQTILDNMHKSARVDKYTRAIRELNKRNIITFASLIVGFPGETSETIRSTKDFIEDAQPQFYRAELYYHGTNSPIHEREAEFGIKSAGYSWRHNSMTWQEACEHVAALYRSIAHSTVLPLYNFDFWCIPYLLGQGLSKRQIDTFVREASGLLIDELQGCQHPQDLALHRVAGKFTASD